MPAVNELTEEERVYAQQKALANNPGLASGTPEQRNTALEEIAKALLRRRRPPQDTQAATIGIRG